MPRGIESRESTAHYSNLFKPEQSKKSIKISGSIRASAPEGVRIAMNGKGRFLDNIFIKWL